MKVLAQPYVKVAFINCPYCKEPIVTLTGLEISYCPYCGKGLPKKEVSDGR